MGHIAITIYHKHGKVTNEKVSVEKIIRDSEFLSSPGGALMMSLSFSGDFGDLVIIEECSFSDVCKVVKSIRYDHPEIFFLKEFCVCDKEIKLSYSSTIQETALIQKSIDEVVSKYLEGIDDSMSAYDVALRLHVKVISEVDYDSITLEKEEMGGPDRDVIDRIRTICGVFIDKKAVCAGYAKAMQYLLQKCGIECAECCGYISKENGERGGGHAWNIVKIDGDYYLLDTTWDDPSNTIQTVRSNDYGFSYFCVRTDEIKRSRDFSLCPIDIPECTAVKANYFYHNNLMLGTYDVNRIKDIAINAAKNGNKFFSIKCESKSVFDETFKKLCAVGDDCFAILKAASKIDKSIHSSSFNYSHNDKMFTITVRFKYKK